MLHMVRSQLGDSEFTHAIHHYVQEHRYSTATTVDFQRSIQQATGKDLSWIFDQLLIAPTTPSWRPLGSTTSRIAA